MKYYFQVRNYKVFDRSEYLRLYMTSELNKINADIEIRSSSNNITTDHTNSNSIMQYVLNFEQLQKVCLQWIKRYDRLRTDHETKFRTHLNVTIHAHSGSA